MRVRSDSAAYQWEVLDHWNERGWEFAVSADREGVRHFAVATNRWDLGGEELLRWHRGKAGTIEQVHRVIKDELAGGVYPKREVRG